MHNEIQISVEAVAALQALELAASQYGDDHPITKAALHHAINIMPSEITAQIIRDAQEAGLILKPHAYSDSGEPLYSLKEVALFFGVSETAAAAGIDEMARVYPEGLHSGPVNRRQ